MTEQTGAEQTGAEQTGAAQTSEPADQTRRDVRLAWAADVPGIAVVQLAQLRASLPPALAGQLPAGEVEQAWRAAVTRPPTARHRVLVATVTASAGQPGTGGVIASPDLGTSGSGRVVGVVATGPAEDPDATAGVDGEVLALHAEDGDPAVEAALLAAAADTLEADGYTRGQLWVRGDDDGLRAVADAAGWVPDGAHRRLAAEPDDAAGPDSRSDDDAGPSAELTQVRLHAGLGGHADGESDESG